MLLEFLQHTFFAKNMLQVHSWCKSYPHIKFYLPSTFIQKILGQKIPAKRIEKSLDLHPRISRFLPAR